MWAWMQRSEEPNQAAYSLYAAGYHLLIILTTQRMARYNNQPPANEISPLFLLPNAARRFSFGAVSGKTPPVNARMENVDAWMRFMFIVMQASPSEMDQSRKLPSTLTAPQSDHQSMSHNNCIPLQISMQYRDVAQKFSRCQACKYGYGIVTVRPREEDCSGPLA
jgi:hypothetical protein